jgi:MFS family permease
LRLAIFSTAAFMGAMDTFTVSVSLRSISPARGHPSPSALSCVLNAYTIIFAALLIPAGSVSGRLGNDRCLVADLTVLSLASLNPGPGTGINRRGQPWHGRGPRDMEEPDEQVS